MNGGSPWVGLLLGVLLTCGVALILGLITLRLQGHYLSLSTIAWGLAIGFLFGNVAWLGKHNGISSVPPISIGSITLIESWQIYYLIWAIVCVSLLLTYNLLDSRIGRAMRCLRGGDTLVESLGVTTKGITTHPAEEVGQLAAKFGVMDSGAAQGRPAIKSFIAGPDPR